MVINFILFSNNPNQVYLSLYSTGIHVCKPSFSIQITLPFESFQKQSLVYFHQFNPFSSHSSTPPKVPISLFWPSYSHRFATGVIIDDHRLLPMPPPTLSFQPVYCQYKFKGLSVSHSCLFFSFSASQFESLQLLN